MIQIFHIPDPIVIGTDIQIAVSRMTDPDGYITSIVYLGADDTGGGWTETPETEVQPLKQE